LDVGPELLAHSGVAIGPELVCVGSQQDRMPVRHATEYLTVVHGEALLDRVGGAQRQGPIPSLTGLSNLGGMLLPALWGPDALQDGVIHEAAPAGCGDTAHEAMFDFRIRAAATLDNPRPDLPQHVRHGKEFVVRGTGSSNT